MKQNSTKSLKWLTGVAVFFSLFATARMTVQTVVFFLWKTISRCMDRWS